MKTRACRDGTGTLKNHPNKMGTTQQHIYTIPLVPFCQLCFVFVSFVHSRVVEGSREGIAGWVLHVHVHGECVCCGWMQYSCSQRDILGWLLFMVTKYPFIPIKCSIRKKLMFQLLFCSLHQSIHSMHKTLL